MTTTSYRVLIVDDNCAIHEDFRKILGTTSPDQLDDLEKLLFDAPTRQRSTTEFELVSAFQGQEAHAKVIDAARSGRPFAMAFVDMRMPPGWDGLQTIEKLWEVDPDLQIVICSAYSDHSWDDLYERLGARDSLLIVKKPFDTVEIVQCAHAMPMKWALARRVREHVDELERTVAARTAALEQSNRQLVAEMAERARIETELRLAQKLEAVGQLAAGMAHEINNPIQYVGDSMQFLREGTVDLVAAIEAIAGEAGTNPTLAASVADIAAKFDVTFLAREMPHAIDRAIDGVARVATIVRAMQELAHPGERDARECDLVKALQNAAIVTAGVHRNVADLELECDQLPAVMCNESELGQVFLNLIVNASHAMEGRGRRGKLRIATKVDGDDVVISIGDNGCGIPERLRDRIFDAFFTTKEVGRGTGQGLTISRAIIVDRHGGSLTFDTELGVGTTFHIRLPICGVRRQSAAAA
ncbi:MAG: hybrid sensor histidine kinase/response regulator [Deltaproteobacteria bacterium]|nr:hybrid sensor histidine kinase/response regulator [Deltaproteobacteria bacterium]